MTPEKAHNSLKQHGYRQAGGIRRRLLAVLGALALCAGLYGAAGWYGAPWLVDRWLAQFAAAEPGRSAQAAAVRFNPFTFVTVVEGLALRDAGTGTDLAADRLVIDFAARSLIERRPVMRAVRIEQPVIRLAASGDLSTLGRRARSAALHHVRIGQLTLTSGMLRAGTAPEPTLDLPRLAVTLTDFDGRDGAAGAFSLDAESAGGARFAAEGTLAPNLERADGHLRLEGLDLGAVTAGIAGPIGELETRGRLELAADFGANRLLTSPALELTDAALELSGLALRPATGLTASADRATAEADLVLASTAAGLAVGGRLDLGATTLTIRDTRASPPQSFPVAVAALLVTLDPEGDGLALNLDGNLDAAGDVDLTLRVPAGSAPSRVSIRAADLPAALLSPYAAEAIGRGLAAGRADVELEYQLNGERVDGSLGIVGRGLALAGPARANARTRPEPPSLELAAALLEDADGVIAMDLSFAGAAPTVREVAGAAVRARLATVAAAPFDALAPAIDGVAGPAGAVPFLPGDTALNDRALATTGQLARALAARPRLGLRVFGAFDPVADREALARQQIELHVQLATAGSDTRGRPQPVDFDSARAQDVLDEFAGERLPAARIDELKSRFDCEGALVPLCRRTYYELLFDALVANEEIAPTTLRRLGRFRAQSVVDALREQGIDAGRLELIADGDASDSPYGVGLPVELTAGTDPEAGQVSPSASVGN